MAKWRWNFSSWRNNLPRILEAQATVDPHPFELDACALFVFHTLNWLAKIGKQANEQAGVISQPSTEN